nr:MAG TPA: hypothetical protein [Caudoviricetes sp.]
MRSYAYAREHTRSREAHPTPARTCVHPSAYTCTYTRVRHHPEPPTLLSS